MTAKKALARAFALFIVIAMALVLSGCPARRVAAARLTSTVPNTDPHRGSAAAAAIYARLAAETTGGDSVEFRLRAARAWLAAGRAAEADRELALIPPSLSQQQTLELNLLRIQSSVLKAVATKPGVRSAACRHPVRRRLRLAITKHASR
jgi:outer membrane PBP1 activator LpoA protein